MGTLSNTSGGACCCGDPGGGAVDEHTRRGPPPRPGHHRQSRVPARPDLPGGCTACPSSTGGGEASCATWTRTMRTKTMKCSWFSCGKGPTNALSSRVCAGCGAGYRPCHNRAAGT